MKRFFYGLFGLLFAVSVYGDDSLPEAEKDKVIFTDLQSIALNEYVQNNVRRLQLKVLELLRSISDSKTLKGTKKDIAESQRRINYLRSLETGLAEANTLDRIKRTLGLNRDGQKEVAEAIKLIRAVNDADTFYKVRSIPGVKPQLLELIDRYEQLEQAVKAADSIEKIKSLPDLNNDGVRSIELLEEDLAAVQNFESAQDIAESSLFNDSLRDKISAMLSHEDDLGKAQSVDQLALIPIVNKKLIQSVEDTMKSYAQLKQNYADLLRENSDLTDQLKTSNDKYDTIRKFSSRLSYVLLRALTGFEYRDSSVDFAKMKEMKITEKAALTAASRTTFSHLGGEEKDVYAITNGILNVLKILWSSKDWTDQLQSVLSRLNGIKQDCAKLNNEADIVKVNINYAIEIVENLLNGAKRPPRDNVKNFNTVTKILEESDDSSSSASHTEVESARKAVREKTSEIRSFVDKETAGVRSFVKKEKEALSKSAESAKQKIKEAATEESESVSAWFSETFRSKKPEEEKPKNETIENIKTLLK